MNTQVNATSDLTSSLWDLINQWFRSWASWWKKLLLILRNITFSVFSLACAHVAAVESASSAAR